MEIITKQEVLEGVPGRYEAQYRHYGPNDTLFDGKKPAEAIAALKALTPPLTEEAVRALTNNSWTDLECDNCGGNHDAVVQLGQQPDYDSRTLNVCGKCLRAAARLLKRA